MEASLHMLDIILQLLHCVLTPATFQLHGPQTRSPITPSLPLAGLIFNG